MSPHGINLSDFDEFDPERLPDTRDAIVESIIEQRERQREAFFGPRSAVPEALVSNGSGDTALLGHNGLEHGRLTKMDAPNIEWWFVNQALNDMARPMVGQHYEDGGVEAVATHLLAGKSEEITERIEAGSAPVDAFNTTARGWPYRPRAFLAKYEHENQDRDSEEYNEDIERLASSVDYSNVETVGGERENPFENEELSPSEAATSLLLRASGEQPDPSDLSEINDHTAFKEAYKDAGNVEDAIQASLFDRMVPNEALRNAADPDEWPEYMDPQGINQSGCLWCNTSLYNIYSDRVGETLVNETGTVEFGVDLSDSDAPYYVSPQRRRTGDPVLCDACCEETEESSVSMALLHRGNHALVSVRSGIIYDRSDEEPSDPSVDPLTSFPAGLRDDILGAASSPPDMYHIQPNEEVGIGATNEYNDAIRQLAESPTDLSPGPAIVRCESNRCEVWINHDDTETIHEVKNLIEENINDV